MIGTSLACLLLAVVAPFAHVRHSSAQAPTLTFASSSGYVLLRPLDTDLVWIELGAGAVPQQETSDLPHSVMVARSDFPGVPFNALDANRVDAGAIRVQVEPQSLCLRLTDTQREPDLPLTTLCPQFDGGTLTGFTLLPTGFTHAYGLGQQFALAEQMDGDLIGRVRAPGNRYGNAMTPLAGGMVGNTQVPVIYFLGEGSDCYALFVDSATPQTWNLKGSLWRVTAKAPQLRIYVLTGPDLPDLRQDYMELTGRPPVPPKKFLGLWVSEYGYDGWPELGDKLATLTAARMPVDGFVLDLQWYGGIESNSGDTSMGRLDWDRQTFPDPEAEVARLKQQGIGLMLIEQPYVGENLDEFKDLQQRGYLVRTCETCNATILAQNPWWGIGGMIDFSNRQGAAYWHDNKRALLIKQGITGHWTDLGEPELYDDRDWYLNDAAGDSGEHSEAAVHNLYNLYWSKGIVEGYQRTSPTVRPFILSRSGTAGSQRYGVAMWSGDIGSNLGSLAAQQNAQMHLSFSGIDYYGSDVGGFMRQALDSDLDELYTQWFADSALFDVPLRPHTLNLCNCNETAPDRVGDVESNRANLLLRYELSPYLYSLAHRAHLYGEPIFPPLAFYYPSDANVRQMASEKLIGRDLLAAVAAKAGVRQQRVYLPAGDWVEYHTHQWHSSPGEWLEEVPLYVDGLFRLPLYARAGAILPQMYVDERTLNIEGQRSDDTRRDELVVTVFASDQPSEFVLYEDDGQSTDYQRGAVRTTVLSQETRVEQSRVRIAAASGSYRGAVSRRDNVVRLVLNGRAASQVTVDGRALPQCRSQADWSATQVACWGNADANLVLARSGTMDVGQPKEFVFALTDAARAELWHGAAEPPSDTHPSTQPTIDLRLWLAVALLLAAGVVVSWRMAQRERSSGAKGH